MRYIVLIEVLPVDSSLLKVAVDNTEDDNEEEVESIVEELVCGSNKYEMTTPRDMLSVVGIAISSFCCTWASTMLSTVVPSPPPINNPPLVPFIPMANPTTWIPDVIVVAITVKINHEVTIATRQSRSWRNWRLCDACLNETALVIVGESVTEYWPK